ncbi:MAG: hypothetical protein GWO24_03460 [Akkermansiaceae bacterium]|nr:hypothetical protein [Akkermansiaceae bacterium]
MTPVFIPENIARDEVELDAIRTLNEGLTVALSEGQNDVTWWFEASLTFMKAAALAHPGEPTSAEVAAWQALDLAIQALQVTLSRKGLLRCDCPDCREEASAASLDC